MKKILKIAILFFAILFSINVASALVKTENDSVLVINEIVNKEHKAELHKYLRQMMQVFEDNGGKPVQDIKLYRILWEMTLLR